MIMVDIVYIVVYQEGVFAGLMSSHHRVLSVWSSRKLAEAAVEFYQGQDREHYKGLDVVERPINVALNGVRTDG